MLNLSHNFFQDRDTRTIEATASDCTITSEEVATAKPKRRKSIMKNFNERAMSYLDKEREKFMGRQLMCSFFFSLTNMSFDLFVARCS